ncbi:MAG: hypothetical protein ACRCV5_00025, partial [Afipia sp.]
SDIKTRRKIWNLRGNGFSAKCKHVSFKKVLSRTFTSQQREPPLAQFGEHGGPSKLTQQQCHRPRQRSAEWSAENSAPPAMSNLRQAG